MLPLGRAAQSSTYICGGSAFELEFELTRTSSNYLSLTNSYLSACRSLPATNPQVDLAMSSALHVSSTFLDQGSTTLTLFRQNSNT